MAGIEFLGQDYFLARMILELTNYQSVMPKFHQLWKGDFGAHPS
jgi:hypothetical protein